MKTAKKLTAILLCIAMLLGTAATTAFAADTAPYPQLKEGTNKIEFIGSPTGTYSFEAAKSGYYGIPVNGEYEFYSYSVSGEDTGRYPDEYVDDNDNDIYIIYLAEGLYEFRLEYNNFEYTDFYSSATPTDVPAQPYVESEITIDYCGEISGVDFVNITETNFCFDECDIYFEDSEYKFITDLNVSLAFSEGKTFIGTLRSCIEKKDKFVSGENKVDVKIPVSKKVIETEAVINGFYVTDYIESIEFESSDFIYRVYDGRYRTISDPVYVVKFKNGTEKRVETIGYFPAEITLPNGYTCTIDYDYYYWDESDMTIYVGDHAFSSCKIREATFGENSKILVNSVLWGISQLNYGWYHLLIGSFFDGETGFSPVAHIELIINYLPEYFEITKNYWGVIANEISMFADYYFG